MVHRTSHLTGLIITLALATGLAVQSHAYDAEAISTIEATIYDSSGTMIAASTPWNWSGGLWFFSNLPIGSGNTLVLLARDAGGAAIYGGSLSDVSIVPDFLTGAGSFMFMSTSEGIAVFAPPFTDLGIIILLPLKVDVAFDIKSGKLKAKGKLSAVVAGSPDVPVSDIDLESLSILGVSPVKVALEDIVTWSEDGEGSPVSTDGADGILDLVLHFDGNALTEALGAVTGGDVVSLVLDGTLTSGTPIEGLDVVTINAAKKDKGKK